MWIFEICHNTKFLKLQFQSTLKKKEKKKSLKTYHQKVWETEPWFCYFHLANRRL